MSRTNDRETPPRGVKTGAYGKEIRQDRRRQPGEPARAPKPRPNVRRKQPRPLSSLLPLLIRPLLFLCAIAIVALAAWSLRLPQFQAKQVSVYGAQTVPANEIASLVPLPAHESLLLYWLQNHSSVAQRVVAAEPVVESARVGVRPPGTLTITVAERQPYALLRQGGQYWIVDRAGVPFRTVSAPVGSLPCIALSTNMPQPALGQRPSLSLSTPLGAGFALLADLASQKIATLMKIREVTVDQNANLCLNMTNNLQIRLGQADHLPEKLALVNSTLTSDSSLVERAAYLDFTDPQRPAWKPRSAAVAASPLTQDLAD